jgi:hypothetical protein
MAAAVCSTSNPLIEIGAPGDGQSQLPLDVLTMVLDHRNSSTAALFFGQDATALLPVGVL